MTTNYHNNNTDWPLPSCWSNFPTVFNNAYKILSGDHTSLKLLCLAVIGQTCQLAAAIFNLHNFALLTLQSA